MTYPWIDIAITFKGLREIPGSDDEPKIVEMYRLCGQQWVQDDETPWCAAFVGACLSLAGYKNSRSLAARSYEGFGEKLTRPVDGCLAVFWRKSKSSGKGHVGFYAGENSKGIHVLGGNQDNKVSVKTYPRSQLLGYVLPIETENLPSSTILPTILEVNAANAPAHLQNQFHPREEPDMAQTNVVFSQQFLNIHPAIEKWEGGYVDHPSDPGGATNMGITRATLSDWRGRQVSKAEVRALTNDEARRIFKAWYFDRVQGDALAGPVALATYNSGVLSGISRASRWLQHSINAMGENIAVDGQIGPQTIAAANRQNAQNLAATYFDRYEAFLRRLGTWPTFGTGWLNRINDMRQFAKAVPTINIMPSQPQPQPTPGPAPQPENTEAIIAALIALLRERDRGENLPSNIDELLSRLKRTNMATPPEPQKPEDLTTVNNAFGPLIGKLLNGRKTGLGIIGLLLTQILPELAPDLAGRLAMGTDSGDTVWQSILGALLAWGVLGKTDKWVKSK